MGCWWGMGFGDFCRLPETGCLPKTWFLNSNSKIVALNRALRLLQADAFNPIVNWELVIADMARNQASPLDFQHLPSIKLFLNTNLRLKPIPRAIVGIVKSGPYFSHNKQVDNRYADRGVTAKNTSLICRLGGTQWYPTPRVGFCRIIF